MGRMHDTAGPRIRLDPTGMKKTRPSDDDYRPLSGRRRLLIVALAVATAVAVILLMLGPKLRAMRSDHERKAAGPQPCSAQQTEACVGGTMGVIVAPGAGAASR